MKLFRKSFVYKITPFFRRKKIYKQNYAEIIEKLSKGKATL